MNKQYKIILTNFEIGCILIELKSILKKEKDLNAIGVYKKLIHNLEVQRTPENLIKE